MSALKLDLGCGKSGKRPEVVERVTLPTEDNPWLWRLALAAIFIAGLLLLHAVPRVPEPIKWEGVEVYRG